MAADRPAKNRANPRIHIKGKKALNGAGNLREERRRIEEPNDDDVRSPFQRDRDRVLYTTAFQRLAQVTQTVAPDEGHVFHNRLTHSIKVAQVARRIAERIIQKQKALSEEIGIDPDVAEAVALAHDLGHPPFGHLAEEELDSELLRAGNLDGFEGNAQSFRLVTKLALRTSMQPGLNLTRATLNGILKYPYMRASGGEERNKWGAYYTELKDFEFARLGFDPSAKIRSAEAEVMDWADDITYAVHDAADFYMAGKIPLENLASLHDDTERKRFFQMVFEQKNPPKRPRAQLEEAFKKVMEHLPIKDRYNSTHEQRGTLRSACSHLIGKFVAAISLQGGASANRKVQINEDDKNQVVMLKQLTWHYVIMSDHLKTQQYGQRRVIRELFRIHLEAAEKEHFEVFPAPYREALKPDPDAPEALDAPRVVADYIASMTEKQVLHLYHRMTGITPGSALH